MALFNHRNFVTPDDIKAATKGVLPHRIITYNRSNESTQDIVDSILNSVPVPTG
jgi:MoxR-like ATPase